jgi:nicotinate-nucleotide pyrophosphorylase (carboxylating)
VSLFDPPAEEVRRVVATALAEDLGPDGDVSAALVHDREARALIVSREAGVLAGEAAATEAFNQIDDSLRVDWMAHDGEPLSPGHKVATIGGRLQSVLTAERTVLNFLGHLSGVATLTRRYADAAASAGKARILDTRKTLPGLRALQKAAVRAGGGDNHRMSLSDMVMLKDNHLAAEGITAAVSRARERWPDLKVEVECDHPDQVMEAVEAGADVVMLDNMTPDEAAWCVAKVGGRCTVEISGGVSLDTVAAYSAAGADWISVGRLTHSAPQLDLALEIRVAPDVEQETR